MKKKKDPKLQSSTSDNMRSPRKSPRKSPRSPRDDKPGNGFDIWGGFVGALQDMGFVEKEEEEEEEEEEEIKMGVGIICELLPQHRTHERI